MKNFSKILILSTILFFGFSNYAKASTIFENLPIGGSFASTDRGSRSGYVWTADGNYYLGSLSTYSYRTVASSTWYAFVYTITGGTPNLIATSSPQIMEGGINNVLRTFTFVDSVALASGQDYFFSFGTDDTDGTNQIRINSSGSSGSPFRWSYITANGSGGGTMTSPAGGGSYEINIGAYTGTPPHFDSEITSFTYSTTTRIANITGYWNVPTGTSTSERLTFFQDSSTLGTSNYVQLIATTTGNFNFNFEFSGLPTPYNSSTTTSPFFLPYSLNARLDTYDENYYDPFGIHGYDQSKYIIPIDSEIKNISALTYDLPDFSTVSGILTYPEYECSFSSLTGCLKNAGVWLAYPSQEAVDQFKTLNEIAPQKFPFSYVYSANDIIQELLNAVQTGTTTVSVSVPFIPGQGNSTITFLSQDMLENVPYSNLIKTILGWMLWIFAIEYVYYRILKTHD